MIKLLSIFLALQVFVSALFPNMDTHDLDSLPELIEHFHEHRKTDHHLSLYAFLKLHYGSDKHKSDDGHSRLPFKHGHNCNSTFSALIQNFSFEFFHNLVIFTDIDLKKGLYFSYLGSFWQPPRQA